MGSGALVAVVLARAYLAFAATLAAAAFAPALVHWDSYVVPSGSMEPSIAVGDVVVGRAMADSEQVTPGRVFVFADPAATEPGRLLVHRVVGRSPEGGWTTKGDANSTADATSVPRTAFRARARILVPYVGLPVTWWRQDQIGLLLGWALLTGGALAVLLLVRPAHRGGPRGPRGSAVRTASALALSTALVVAPGVDSASGAFTANTRNPGSSWSAGAAVLQPYNKAVLADSPYFYYLLDEASGGSAQDYSGNGRTGILASLAGYRSSGALAHNFGYAVNLGGGTARIVSGGSTLTDPRAFTVELWFRTSSRAGGTLFGFENTQAALSSTYDRQLTMRTDGKLVYGDWVGQSYHTVVSPAAYNDGGWHHLVLTSTPDGQDEQAVVYVDGAAVASGKATRTGAYSGWWRVGYGRTSLGAVGFPGLVDQVAVYRATLSAARVQAHWAAR